MKLHVDLETLQLIEGPGFRNPITSLRFKRGDAAQLEVTFLEGGSTAASIGNPLALEIQFGIKPRSRYDIGYLVHDAVWTMPAIDAEAPVYRCSPSFNTVELDSALGVGSSTGTELSEITLMGEITWREGAGEPTSTRTFLVVVENDVNRGTEGVPSSAEPAYPAAESLVTLATLAPYAKTVDLAPYAKTEDLAPIERTSAPVNETAQKVTITGSAEVTEETTVNFSVGWAGGSVTVSMQLLPEDAPPPDFIPQNFAAQLNTEFTNTNPNLYASSSGSDVIVQWTGAKPASFSISSDYGSPAVPCDLNGNLATIQDAPGQSLIDTTSKTEWTAVSLDPVLWKPSTYAAGSGLSLSGNTFSIGSNVALKTGPQTFSGTQTFSGAVAINGTSTFYNKMWISYSSSTVPSLEITQGQTHHTALKVTGVIRGKTTGTPASITTPPAGEYVIYAEDNGSGKMRLMVKFPTGAAQQIAIEP